MTRIIRTLLACLLLIGINQIAVAAGVPATVFSTYLGGTGFDEGFATTTDGAGNIYVAGVTTSPAFPKTGKKLSGPDDFFISKFSPIGQLLQSTRVGGSNFDEAYSIAVDQNGYVYVAGATGSSDLTIINGFQKTYGGGFSDAFVVKLDPSGKIAYSSYIGGSGGNESAQAIAVDGSGNAYIAGRTDSTDFPLANALQNTYGGGSSDAFVIKIDTNAKGRASLMYSTYLGGFGFESGNGIAIDVHGNAYVTGTADCCFPTTPDAFQSYIGNAYSHVFLSKLSSLGALHYSTLIGGSNHDAARAIAVDQFGTAYVTGETSSSDFPVTINTLQSENHSFLNAFILKLDPSISGTNGLMYSTYLGGEGPDSGSGVAVDAAGRIYATGYTSSATFPTQNPIQPKLGGNKDAFLVQLDPAVSGIGALLFGTYLGGPNDDESLGLSLAPKGLAVITGFTDSPFPLLQPFQPSFGGSRDAFVASIAFDTEVLTTTTLASSENPSHIGDTVMFNATITVQGNAVPTGVVTFKQGSVVIGTSALVDGSANLTVPYGMAGTHFITATYSGDANYIGSESAKLKQVVRSLAN